MNKTTDSSTLHNSFVKGSQANFQEKTGENSFPTQAPTEFDKSVIVQSSPEEFDAVARAEIIIEKKYTKYEAFLRLCDIYQDGMRGIATDKNFEVGKLVSFIGISNIFK